MEILVQKGKANDLGAANLRRNLYRGGIAEETLAVRLFALIFWLCLYTDV